MENFIYRSMVFMCCVLFLGCTGAAKTETKAPAKAVTDAALDAETTDSAEKAEEKAAAPATKEKPRTTRLRGKVVVVERLEETPLKNTKVALVSSDNVVLAEATTGSYGEFTMSGIFKNGRYRLKVLSGKYSSSQSIDIDSHTVDNIVLRAEKQPQGKRKDISE